MQKPSFFNHPDLLGRIHAQVQWTDNPYFTDRDVPGCRLDYEILVHRGLLQVIGHSDDNATTTYLLR
jgi:hypothetical protein